MAVENISGSGLISTEFMKNSRKAAESVAMDTQEIVEKPIPVKDDSKGVNFDSKA